MAPKQDPNETVHLQVAKGETVVYRDHAYGDRATLQVRRGELDAVKGSYEEVNPEHLLDVAERPTPAPSKR